MTNYVANPEAIQTRQTMFLYNHMVNYVAYFCVQINLENASGTVAVWKIKRHNIKKFWPLPEDKNQKHEM